MTTKHEKFDINDPQWIFNSRKRIREERKKLLEDALIGRLCCYSTDIEKQYSENQRKYNVSGDEEDEEDENPPICNGRIMLAISVVDPFIFYENWKGNEYQGNLVHHVKFAKFIFNHNKWEFKGYQDIKDNVIHQRTCENYRNVHILCEPENFEEFINKESTLSDVVKLVQLDDNGKWICNMSSLLTC